MPSATPAVIAKSAVLSTTIFKDDIFKGKVLLCTGGGSGIGKTMTEAMMRHGASATIVGRKLDRLEVSARELSDLTKQRCIAAQADVRKPDQLKAAVEKTIKEFDRLDFVICGAAGNFLAPIDGMSENAFRTVIEIDTLGTYNTIKATLPHVRESHGSYVHISATMHWNGTPYQAHISSAKAAIDALSAVLAVEEGPRGVRSNVLAPGPIGETEGMERLKNNKFNLEDVAKTYVPLQRMGQRQDVANMGVFLFSEAALWITGHVFVVDGGSEHLRTSQLPYPASVLDPEGIRDQYRGKL